MIKLTLFILLSSSFLFGSVKDIEKKINNNQEEFNNVVLKKSNINKNISFLANKINKEEDAYDKIVTILERTNTQLLLNSIKLSSAQSKVEKLKKESAKLSKSKEKIEQEVIDFVIERYAMSMGIEQAKKESLKDVIGKEVYTLVFDNVRQDILDINIDYLKINNKIRDNEKKVKSLNQYITKQKAVKEKYKNLEVSQNRTLQSLRKKHASYQNNLQTLVDKQNKISDLLGSLNILKKEEVLKEKARIKKAKALARKKS